MTDNTNNKRLAYIDLVKGLAILLLLLSHSVPEEDHLKTWIFSFHMPIFFYVCGIITRTKIAKHPINIYKHLKNRLRNLIIPYFLFGFLLIIFYTFLDYKSTNSIHGLLPRTLNLLCLQGIDSLWFIPVYFFSEIVYIITLNIRYRKSYSTLILLCLCFICIYSNIMSLIKQISIGLLFISAGYYHQNYYNYLPKSSFLYLLLIFTFYFGSILNGFSSMQNMNHAILYFINGIGTSFAIIAFVQHFENKINTSIKKHLLFWGTNTLIILCTNNLIIEIVRLIDWKLTNSILLNNGYIGHLIFFLIITILEIPTIKLLEGKFK